MSFKRTIILLVITVCSSAVQAQTASAEEKMLLDIERSRTEALNTRNNGTLGSIYQDLYKGTTAEGVVVDKKAQLEVFKTIPKDVVFSAEEVEASIYGYAGVTAGKLTGKNKDGTIASQIRFMHVYTKRNGQWKIVEGQSTPIK